MKAQSLWLLVLAGCPSDPSGNAPVLWLALDGRETEVKLAEEEPDPY
jgi:hypothetical protein